MISEEQETVITTHQGAPYVQIWTAQRRFISALDKNPTAELIKRGEYEGSPWAQYRVPADRWSPTSGIKRQITLTDEQKQALAVRLKTARDNQLGNA